MDLVFNNVYLLTAMAETDPSLEVFFKLMMVSRLYNHYVKANPGVRAGLYRLHDGWLVAETWTLSLRPHCIRSAYVYRHPITRELHRYSGPAIVDSFIGRPGYSTYYINGQLLPRTS